MKAIALLVFTIATANPDLPPATVRQVATELSKYPSMIHCIVRAESTFNPKAKRGPHIGLMQINHLLWSEHLIKKGIIKRRSDLWKPKYNLRAGYYLYNIRKEYYATYKSCRPR